MKKGFLKSPLIFIVILALLAVIGQTGIPRSPESRDFPLKQLWKTRFNENIVGLTADGKMVLVRTKTLLNALDAQSGDIVWEQKLSWQADPQPAVISNNKVYVTDGRFVRAINQMDGSIIWQQATTDSSAWVTYASEDIVIVNQVGVDILVFDSQNGTLLWRKPACRGFVPAFADHETVYVPCNGLDFVDLPTGKTLGNGAVGTLSAIAYSPGIVYYFVDSLKAYDLQRQTILWSTALSKNGLEGLTIVQDMLFYMDASQLCMLDVSSGHIHWCAKSFYPQSPTMIGENTYTFDGNHKTVTAIRVSDGRIIGTLKLPNFNYFIIDRRLLDSSGALLFFSNGKVVYAYTD